MITKSLQILIVACLITAVPAMAEEGGGGASGGGGSHKFLSVGVLGGVGVGMMPAIIFGLPFGTTGYGAVVGVKPLPHLEIAGIYKMTSAYSPGAATATVFGNMTQIMGEIRWRPADNFGFYVGPMFGTQTYTAVSGLATTLVTTTLGSGFIWGLSLGLDLKLADFLTMGFDTGYQFNNPVAVNLSLKFWL